MVFEFRELKWALITAQHRSLRRAAETLNIRQSTLSRRLRGLEEQLGVTLFERTNGGTRPTAAGQEFFDTARHLLNETEAMTARLISRSRGASGRLTVGVHAALSAGNLRATLVDYQQRFPDVELSMVDGSSDHLISDLAGSVVDVAFIAEENPRWDGPCLPVWSERIVVAVPGDHSFSGRDVVRWSELKTERLLVPRRGPGPEFLKLLVAKVGCPEPGRLLRQDVGLDRLLTMVGAGWGLLLALEGATGAIYPNVIYREIQDSDGPTRLNFSAYWHQTNGNPSLAPFLAILRERYPDLSGP